MGYHKGSYKRETGGSRTEKDNMMSKPETGVMYFQDKGRDHRSKNAGKL